MIKIDSEFGSVILGIRIVDPDDIYEIEKRMKEHMCDFVNVLKIIMSHLKIEILINNI